MANPPPPVVPVVATVSLVPDAKGPVILPAASSLVTHTAFLGWLPAAAGVGGAAQVSLDTWQMLKAFGARLSASQLPADLAASRNVGPLTIQLTGACWTRVLNEYLASNLLACSFSTRSELHDALLNLTVVTPGNLVIVAADWVAVEATTAIAPTPGAPAVPAVPARRASNRGGVRIPAVQAVPAIPAVPPTPGRPALDPALDYLAMVDVLDLEITGTAPWLLVSFLAGALGACLLQSERNRAASQVQISARAISGGSQARFGSAVGDNHSLAGNLRDYLQVLAYAPAARCAWLRCARGFKLPFI